MPNSLPYMNMGTPTYVPDTDFNNTMTMTMSTNNNTKDEFVFDDMTQRYIVGIAVLCTSVLGILGNSLVILSVILSKKLRIVSNTFVVNLAISDLCTSLCTPWNAVALLSQNGWPIRLEVCTVAAGILFVCVGCSLFNLASIAIDRYIVITRLYRVDKTVYPKWVLAIWVALTWIIPFCVFILPPIHGIGGLGYNSKYFSCSQLSSVKTSNTYDIISSVGLYPIPLIIIITSYTTIYCHIYKHTKNLMSLSGAEKGSKESKEVTSRLKHRQVQITKTMFYVVCAFFFCITPYGICLIVDTSDPAVPYAATLVLMNSCINPLIYAKHPLFKNVYGKILTCMWKEVINEETESLMRMRTIAQSNRQYISLRNNSSRIV
ncbi:melatonin receptor type 1A-like [Amphiura filiformis]|uniref:melatonin receptor type 1A-like n=1 Tax=Amphiura filiformis TaxID=82378 RepID=UPI003B21121E